MDEAFKATFGEVPSKQVSLDEAFENTFGKISQPTQDSSDFETQVKAMKAAGMTNEQIKAQYTPDKLPGASRYAMPEPESVGGKALDYAKRALLGVDTGLANSMSSMYQGAGALADSIVHYANAPYNYVAEKTGLPKINTNGNPVTRLLLDQGEKVGGLAQRFSDEGLQGRDPNLFDQTAQGVGSTAGFFLPGLVSAGSSALPGMIGKAGAFATTAGGLEALSEGGSAYADQLKQGASQPEARSAFAKTAILNLPIDIATDAIGTVLGGGSVVRKALARGFSEMTQETLQGVLSGITSQRKPDGTPYTWGDLARATPEMAKAVPETLRNEGVPAFLSSMLIGAGEGVHGKVTARQEARAQAKSLMTLDEAFEAIQTELKPSTAKAMPLQTLADPRVTDGIAEERGMQPRHQRFPADPPASSEGALLHRPGEETVAAVTPGVNDGVHSQALADRCDPVKLDAAAIRAHRFTARPVPESVSNISLKGRPEEEIRSIARARVNELAQQTFHGIEGEEIYFAPGQGEDWDSYTNHLISGIGGTIPNAGRAKALWLVEDTIARPVAVFDQQNGNRAYISLYEGDKQRAHHIVVQVAPDGRARTVTSLISKDSGINSAKASNYVKSQIERASDVLYVEGVTEEKGLRTRHWRGPTDQLASQESALLHKPGNKNIAPDSENVNGETIQALQSHEREARFFEPEMPVREPDAPVRDKPVTIAEIRQAVDKLVPWRHGKTMPGTLGNFKVEPEVVRSKNRNDVSVIMHEVGHFIDKKLGLEKVVSGAEQELAQGGLVASAKNYTPEQVRAEGVAQFFLHYSVDEKQAREKFPEYYQAFEGALAQHPELQPDIATIKDLVSSYYRQTSEERLQANIVRGTDKLSSPLEERLRKGWNNFNDKWIDALAPLKRVTEEIRQKMGWDYVPDEYNSYAKARTAPGFKGRAGQDTAAFLDVIRDLNPEDHTALSNYLAASRALNYRAKDMEPGLGTSLQEDRHVFGSAPDHIKNAAMKLHDVYNDMVQKTLVKTGIMSQEQFDYLQMEWPDYVPFIRVDTTAMLEHDLAAFMRGSKKSLANLGNPIKKATGVGDAATVYPIRDPLEAMLRNMQVFHSLAARNEVGKTMINIAGIEGMGRFAERVNGPGEKGDKVFYVWNDGKREYYATDPDVYDALMAVNEGSPDSMGFLSKTLIKVADWFKMGTTRYNPAFALFRNLPRDSWEASINSESWAPPMVNSLKGLIIQYSNNPKMKALLDEATQEGLLYSGITEIRGNSPKALANELKKAFREGGMTGAAKRKFVDLWEWIGSHNEAIEVAPKLQEYLYLRSKGVPKQEAAMRAREVNIDFARAGTKGRVVNRYTAFFNAQVQGMDKAARTFKARPKETALKMALFAGIPSLVAWALGNFDDDETKKEYNDIPKGLKDLYWHYKVGGEWLRMPKPNAYGVFGSLVERALDSAYRKDPTAFRGFMDTLWGEAVPPVVPSALMPAIEVWANKSSFTGRPIVSRKCENLPPEMQYGPQTSGVAKQMGELLGVSPMMIDHMIRGVTGTVGGEVAKLPDRLVGDRNREAEKLTELPLIRTSFSQPYRNSEAIDRFYELAERTSQAKIRYETKRKAGEQAEVGKDLRFAQQFAHASKALSDLRKKRATIQQHPSLSPASKRKYLDEMDERMVDLARGVLDRYDGYGK